MMSHCMRRRCWVEWTIVSFGLPALTPWLAKLIKTSLPAAQHGSEPQRFLLSFAAGILSEWIVVLGVWLLLKRRGQNFKSLGTWRIGNCAAWALALSLASLSTASNLRFLPRMHVPISNAFMPHGFHLAASPALGITAGFCEEVLFRGFLMTEFADAGYSGFAQVFFPGLGFAVAHLGYSVYGVVAAIGIIIPTALLGMLWGVAYLLGKRALVPCMVAHFINDATAGPWIAYFMFTGKLG
jgi:membrane protease YdiL (CAAX protease family)